jgi:phosphate acyltransferase
MLTIAVDAMGGDHGPMDMVAAVAAASLKLDVEILLVGHERTLTSLLSEQEHNPERIGVYHAADAVGQYEDAARAVDDKVNSSIHVAMRLVADGVAQTLVTAGNSRAVLLAALRHLPLIDGVTQAAVSSVYPTETRRGEKEDPFTLLLDIGGASHAGSAELVAFAVMGSAYAAVVSRNPRPRVALLGGDLAAELPEIAGANDILRAGSAVHYVGSIDPMDIPRGAADVVVSAGFYGNLVLNLLEGTHETILSLARYAHKERALKRAALWMLQGAVGSLKGLTDWEQYGGAPILGFEKPIIRAHGRSHSRALLNAIKVASKVAGSDLAEQIREGMAATTRE